MKSRPTARDEGFTLVEVLLAMVLIVVVMTALLGVLVSSLSTIAQARQRQTATALATQALERLRALPYDEVTQTDGTAPQTGLQYVATSGGGYWFRPLGVLDGVDEPLVVNGYSGRFQDQTVDNVTYRIQTYVTRGAQTAAGEQPFNLTALVSWESSVSGGTRAAAQRSVAYSPAGCLSTAQSPFAAPCQAYFTAQSGQSVASVSLTNPADSSLNMQGFDGTLVELSLSGNASSLLVEQTATANADAETSGARTVASTTSTSGGLSAAASVDSDPSSTPGQSETETIAQSAVSRSLSGAAGTLLVTPTSGDSGRASAAIGADTTTCVGADGTALATGPSTELQPCASSRVNPAGSAGSVAYVPGGFGSLTVPLTTVAASGSPARAVSAKLTSANPGACATGAGPGTAGCSYAESRRSVGTSSVGTLGTLPGGVGASAPTGWDGGLGLFTVTGLTESARVEEGNAARSPLYTRSGSLRIWDGAGYTAVDLSAFASPATGATPASQTWAVPDTSVTYTQGGSTLEIAYTAVSVSVARPESEHTPATRTGDPAADCKVDACVSRLNGGGVVVGNATVTIVRDGVAVGSFGLSMNLGGLVAEATYKAAANA
jgi:prepilin-type N-terminal cleavage/methylation domain-containing protein